jgi:ketosteroid isomerase-like protein
MGLVENKEIIHALYEAGNRGDIASCLTLLTDDVRWTNIGSTKYSGTYVGKQALTENLLGPIYGQLKAGILFTLENVVAEGEYVVVQARGEAEAKDGRPYNNSYCHVFRIRNGKISEVTEYFDTELTSSVFGR